MNSYEIFVIKFWEERINIFNELRKIYEKKIYNNLSQYVQFTKNFQMIQKTEPQSLINNKYQIEIGTNIFIKFNYNNSDIYFPIYYFNLTKINETTEPIFSIGYLLYIIKHVYKIKDPYGLTYKNKEYSLDNCTLHNLLETNNLKSIFDNPNVINYRELIEINKIKNIEILNLINEYFNLNHLNLIELKEINKCQILNIKNIIEAKNNERLLNNSFDFNKLNNNIYNNIKFKSYKKIFINNNIFNEIYILDSLQTIFLVGKRFFYINLAYIKSLNKDYEKKKYLSFWISKIFPENKLNEIEKFISENIMPLNSEKNNEYILKIIEKIVKKNNEFQDNSENKEIYLIINNINYKYDNDLIDNIFKMYKEGKEEYNVHIIEFYSIKENFLYLIEQIFNNNDDYQIEFLNNIYKDGGLKYEENNYNSLSLQFKSKEDYEFERNAIISDFFNSKNDLELFIDLIRIFHFDKYYNNLKYQDEKLSFIKEKNEFLAKFGFIKNYLNFINIEINVKKDYRTYYFIQSIKFKESIIYEKFKNKYIDLFVYATNNENYLTKIIGSSNGIFFEKQIIFDLLTESNNKLFKNFQSLEIDNIYCFRNPKLNNNINYNTENFIFNQLSSTGEVYDFAFKISSEKYNIMKSYQISHIKNKIQLNALSNGIVTFDNCYSQQKMKELNINIDFFTFGIITSLTTYCSYLSIKKNKYKKKSHTFYLMQKFCEKNSYEFYVYDIFKRQFYLVLNTHTLIPYNICTFHKIFKLHIPNIKFLTKKISLKYFNFNRINSIVKYLKTREKIKKIEIVSKNEFSKEYIDNNIYNDNIGIIILGKNYEESTKFKILKYKGKTHFFGDKINKEDICKNKYKKEIIIIKLYKIMNLNNISQNY